MHWRKEQQSGQGQGSQLSGYVWMVDLERVKKYVKKIFLMIHTNNYYELA